MAHTIMQDSSGNLALKDEINGGASLFCAPGHFTATRASATVARTDTTAKNLFVLPRGAVPISIVIYSTAVSDAATTATISVGITGTNNYFLSAYDVKGATGSGRQSPTALTHMYSAVSTTATTQVVGIYAETGTASTAGGPWVVEMHYYVPTV